MFCGFKAHWLPSERLGDSEGCKSESLMIQSKKRGAREQWI